MIYKYTVLERRYQEFETIIVKKLPEISLAAKNPCMNAQIFVFE